ncbi:HK97 family phage prohead protease [Diaphorobacter caeni]|uniref:HK97 family phage prohead protease n=1 Tax=Diaphorobacter caeni TaxID=2784387 RepID=UPI001E513292|nr:HK97 family phage prohead protease [Diaphorobacter caeni]
MNRAYSVLNVKALNEEARVIEGMATTPEPDRVGDIVVSEGVQFKNPSPLLWQHQHDKPVGMVEFGQPTSKGVPFKARLPKIDEPGPLKDRVDEAWQSVKAGLVTAVSIGFRPLDDAIELLKTGGVKFLKTEVFELSLVTIPANASAVITAIKSADRQHLPASGQAKDGSPPGVSGNKKAAYRGAVLLIPRKGSTK